MTRSPSPVSIKTTQPLESLEEEMPPNELKDIKKKSNDENLIETTNEKQTHTNKVDDLIEKMPVAKEDKEEEIVPEENNKNFDNNKGEEAEEEEENDAVIEEEEQIEDNEEIKEEEKTNGNGEVTLNEENNIDETEISKTIEETVEEAISKEMEKEKSISLSPQTRSRSHSRSRSRSHTPSHHNKTDIDTTTTISKSHEKSSTINDENKPLPEDEPVIEDFQFGLSWVDSDLHLHIDPITFNSAKPMSHEIFSLVWSGARTNYGVREGKVCFEVRLSEEIQIDRSHKFRNEPNILGCRVGFSTIKSNNLLLGENELSFAYCETGRKALNKKFEDYSKPFELDDVIGCYLDLDSIPCTIKYTLNGEDLGVAFEFDKETLGEEDALFPHVLTKGYEFQVNFADNDNLLANTKRPIRKKRKPHVEKEIIDGQWEVIDEAKMDEPEKSTEIEDEDEGKEKVQNDDNDSEKKDIESTENEEKTKDENEKENKEEEKEKHEKVTNDEDDSNGPSPNKRLKTDENIEEQEKTSTNAINEDDEYEEIHPQPRETVELLPNYELIALIAEEKYIPGLQRPVSRSECEVIILIGLPGVGKTYWTKKHIAENAEKRYYVIGADSLIEKMTIDGESRKSIHKGNWDTVYESCISSLTLIEEIAVKRRRNFILDQTNVYASVQRRKMKGFGEFKRIAVVCLPTEEEHKRRQEEKSAQENHYNTRESTLNNLRANFSLPSLEFTWFDDIIYTDLSGDEAKAEVKKINEKGKKATDTNRDKNRSRNRDYQKRDERRRYDDRRRDFRQDTRWGDRRNNYGMSDQGMSSNMNSRWQQGGAGGYHRGGGGGSGGGGWRDDRNYMGGAGRGYDNRPRHYGAPHQQSSQNWMQNNRPRYNDRYQRSGGGGGGRYDNYGNGGSGGRDYRDRERERNGGSGGGGGGSGGGPRRNSYRSGGGGGNNQRDFRPGHRDNRTEDSRGGYDRSTMSESASSKYNNSQANYNTVATNSYDHYKNNGKWQNYVQYNQNHMQQPPYHTHPHHQQQQQHDNSWQHQYQQPPPTSGTLAGQQNYWGYDYGQQQDQSQWHANDGSQQQQQEWAAWWQQQEQTGAATTTTENHTTGVTNSGNTNSIETHQYWSQYMYGTPTENTVDNTATTTTANTTITDGGIDVTTSVK